MLRQRIAQRTSPLAFIGRLLVALLACALIWYGLMTVLLAVKVAPDTVNSISGYRTAFDWLSGLTPADVDGGQARAITAAAGIVAFLLFGYLACKEIPRPRLTRHDLELAADEHGEVIVGPRAIERIAETAAKQHPAVIDAAGRVSDDDLTINITVRQARDLPGTLRSTQQRVTDALGRHDLPARPVNVTLTGYDRSHRRELH